MCQCSKSHRTLRQPSFKHKQVLLPEAICCCLQTCKCGFDIRVVLCTSIHTKSHSQECKHNQVMAININLLPEAVCCCLHTCKSCK